MSRLTVRCDLHWRDWDCERVEPERGEKRAKALRKRLRKEWPSSSFDWLLGCRACKPCSLNYDHEAVRGEVSE